MFYYELNLQFVKANVPSMFDSKIKFDMETAKEVYNSESMLATNPKKIVEGFPIDRLTYTMILRSKNKLDNPTKAIRRFSSFLASNEYLGEFVTARRLFKLTSQELTNYNDPDNEIPASPVSSPTAGITKFEKDILSDIISIFYSTQTQDIEIKNKLIDLFQQLTETPF